VILRWIKIARSEASQPDAGVGGETQPILTRINGPTPPAFENGARPRQ